LVFLIDQDRYAVSAKIKAENTSDAIAHLEKTWKKFLPDQPVDYLFVDQLFADLYKTEQIRGKLFTGFTFLSILIASLGLFGLISYSITVRVKEIGIRKILGASVSSIIGLLSRGYLKLILLSNLIALPLGYYLMNKWLENFAYKIEWQWWYFAGAGMFALILALLVLGFQSGKAAMENPVNSLRSE